MLRGGESKTLKDLPRLSHLEGDSNADGARVGENFSIGVEVMLLLGFVLDMSRKIFGDRIWSRRDLLTERFSGEPLPGRARRLGFVSARKSKSLARSLQDPVS